MSDIADPLVYMVMFIIFAMSMAVYFEAWNAVPDLGQPAIKAQGVAFFTAIDGLAIFIVIAIILATIGSAFLIKTNPLWFVVSVVLMIVQLIILPPLVNVANSVFQGLSSAEGQFPFLIWLVQISPIVSFIGGTMAAIIGLRGE